MVRVNSNPDRNSQGPAPLDAEDFFESEVIFETETEVP